jgi:GWxTD domain-containing protein
MTMKRVWRAVPLLLFLLPALILPASQNQEKNLPQPYRDWLKVVSYIILPAERDVFRKLATDRERDIFIESFWRQRDPTPGTPQNEYKDEHLKRFNYANAFYRRWTSREGWMTDMGMIHIILGPPTSIERFDSVSGIYPCQVWYYYGDKSKGLPTYFGLLFFQKGGAGEYRLYNPVSDGPASLLIDNRTIDVTNHEKVYEKIRELAPTLAGPSLSIIPDERPYYDTPSPRNAILLAQILESPRKDVSPAYATHFLTYKGIVSIEYLTNYIESTATAEVIPDRVLGLNFLHFSISPRRVSLDYYQPRDQYYGSFKLSVSLRQGEKVVFQYSKDYPSYFPPDRVENIQANGLSILDLCPIAEGKYSLTVLLQNAVGKEFSLFEQEVEVPGGDGPARLMTPVLGYKLQDAPAASNAPFKILGRQILTDPKSTLGLGDGVAYGINLIRVPRDLWAEGGIDIAAEGSNAKGKPIKVMTIKLSEQPYGRAMTFLETIPARSFPPDYYEMSFVLKNGRGEVVDRASAPFIVSPAETVPHPVTLVRTLPVGSEFLYFYGLAIQYEKTGEWVKAEAVLRKAHEMKPDYPDGLVQYADFLVRAGKYDEALGLVEPLRGSEKFRFDYYLIKGRALKEKGQYGPAIQSLLDGNKIYNSDTRLLNALGFCYYRTGKKKEALDVLSASLRLNPEQADIKELLATVEKELR